MRHFILAASLIALPFGALAQDDPNTPLVEARQGFFKLLGANMNMLAGMAQGDIPYDEETASVHATNIETLTGYNPAFHFVEGTSSADREGTRALPAIWQDLDGFLGKYSGLQQAAAGAGDAVRGGQSNLAATVQKLGAACKDCHDNYRAE